MLKRLCLVFAACLGSCGPQPDDQAVYTLYRSPGVGTHHIHVATFDAPDGEAYNKENCEIVAGLMQGQPGVSVQYYCHAGRARSAIFD